MMECKQAKELMDAYLDGFLDETEQREFTEHIASCPDCRIELEELRLMLSCLHESAEEEIEPPAELKDSVIRILNVQQQPAKVIPIWRGLAIVAAGVLIVIGISKMGFGTNLKKTINKNAADMLISSQYDAMYNDNAGVSETASTPNESSAAADTICSQSSTAFASKSASSAATTKSGTTNASNKSMTQTASSIKAAGSSAKSAGTATNSLPQYLFIATLKLTGTNSTLEPELTKDFAVYASESGRTVYILFKKQYDDFAAEITKRNLSIDIENTGASVNSGAASVKLIIEQ